MRRMLVIAAFVLAVVGVAVANLPVADDVEVTSSSLLVIPDGCSSVDLLSDGTGFITFRDGGSKVVTMVLRSGAVRSFQFKPGYFDSVYVGLDSATEVLVTWMP